MMEPDPEKEPLYRDEDSDEGSFGLTYTRPTYCPELFNSIYEHNRCYEPMYSFKCISIRLIPEPNNLLFPSQKTQTKNQMRLELLQHTNYCNKQQRIRPRQKNFRQLPFMNKQNTQYRK
jgi:hypothetical protein